ncbi:Mss4-like protein [Aspergillus granulosus]|uniref:Mss4-like protein n=1 Tax=Aspergillus granulosus TaxID=176169 RepID=A0ABR4H657_9EURO
MTEKDPGYQDRPPYQIRSDTEFGEAKWRASCHCGQVTYKISRRDPLNAKYCHCRGCQVTHGAPFQWCGIFHKSDIMFNKGTEGLTFYSSQNKSRDYQLPTKIACAHCRSPIMDEGRRVCLVFPELIDYEASGTDHATWGQAFEPKLHIFYGNRAIDILDGKPKWTALDGQSDLLDDYGHPKKDDGARTRI